MATTLDRTAVLDKTAKGYLEEVYLDRLAAQQDEARSKPPARLNATMRYVFRAKPGTHRSFSVAVPQLPVHGDERVERDIQARFRKKYSPEQRAEFDAIVDTLGEPVIRFTSIPGDAGTMRQGECYYQTDDAQIAAYLRARKAAGGDGWQHIEEVSGTGTIEVEGATFPDTDEGAIAARRYRLALRNAEEPVSAQAEGPQTRKNRATPVQTQPAPVAVGGVG